MSDQPKPSSSHSVPESLCSPVFAPPPAPRNKGGAPKGNKNTKRQHKHGFYSRRLKRRGRQELAFMDLPQLQSELDLVRACLKLLAVAYDNSHLKSERANLFRLILRGVFAVQRLTTACNQKKQAGQPIQAQPLTVSEFALLLPPEQDSDEIFYSE